jgi:hypothetical protein
MIPNIDSKNKYEPTPYMKRVTMFNRQVEESYQAIRKAHNETVFGELTPEEQEEWEKISHDK